MYDLSLGSKLKPREEYRFAKEFLKDIDQEPKPHHLAIERGYYAIAGTSAVKASETSHLISLTSPDKSLKNYVLSRKYVELNEQNHTIEFRKKYKNRWSRNWRKGLSLTVYFLGSFFAISPFMLTQPFNLEPKFMLLAFATIPCFGFFAFDSLHGFIKIMRGEALVKEQQKHPPLIIVKNQTKKTDLS